MPSPLICCRISCRGQLSSQGIPTIPGISASIGRSALRGLGAIRRVPLSWIPRRKPFGSISAHPVIPLPLGGFTTSVDSTRARNRKARRNVRSDDANSFRTVELADGGRCRDRTGDLLRVKQTLYR